MGKCVGVGGFCGGGVGGGVVWGGGRGGWGGWLGIINSGGWGWGVVVLRWVWVGERALWRGGV